VNASASCVLPVSRRCNGVFEAGGLRIVASLASWQHGRLLHRAPGAVGVRIARQLCVVDWCALHRGSMSRPESCGSTVSRATARRLPGGAFPRPRAGSGVRAFPRVATLSAAASQALVRSGRQPPRLFHALASTRDPVQEAVPPVPAPDRPPAASGQEQGLMMPPLLTSCVGRRATWPLSRRPQPPVGRDGRLQAAWKWPASRSGSGSGRGARPPALADPAPGERPPAGGACAAGAGAPGPLRSPSPCGTATWDARTPPGRSRESTPFPNLTCQSLCTSEGPGGRGAFFSPPQSIARRPVRSKMIRLHGQSPGPEPAS
jgi:hypothetical protein